MNDFPELTPPPERNLTAAQRTRILGRLAQVDEQHEDLASRSWWVTGGAAAAAVLIVVGGAFALSRTVGSGERPAQPAETPTVQPRTDPLPFEPRNGEICLAAAPRTDIWFDQVTPLRDLVLSGAGLEGASGAVLDRSWIALRPEGAIGSSGEFDETKSGISKDAGWDDRQPLVGARLLEGKTYSLFARVKMVPGSVLHGIRFDYTDAGSPGSSIMDKMVRADLKC